MSKKVNINYNETFATTHSRDYYRGASFKYSGNWIVGAHYFSDDYNVDFVVHGQVLLACAKSHLSTLENEPKEFIFDESGNITGVVSEHWDFVLSGIKGETPGIKIEDNYWWICQDINNPVWINTGVKAKMELSDLSPEEIALLQEPGLQVVNQFVENVITQSLGQNTDRLPSQKLVTDELQNRATKAEMSAAFINAKQIYDLTYQPIGDYATNTNVNNLLATKVDKVEGKQLSTEDYTTEEKQKLSGIESDAQVNVIEVIKKNGTALSINNKEVDIPIPTRTSDITNDSGFITQGEVIVNQNFPSGWRKSGSILNLIEDINNDSTATTGKSYLSTVRYNDLPAGLVQGEMKVEVMADEAGIGKVILFTLTSSSNAPYHWEYTSAWRGSGTWRAFVEESQLAAVATSGSYNDLSDTPTNVSDFNNDTGFITATLENDMLILE